MKTLVSLCKRRGFIFPSSEIYGGINACYDYGPLGVLLKNNIKKLWWNHMTRRMDIVGLDASILMHPDVWKASGHLDGFSDPLVQCKNCKNRHKAQQTLAKCPSCGSEDLTEPRDFNLMFKTFMGPLEDTTVFLRPETAQGIYVNFENVRNTMRLKIPFGIAQIGKSFRNEITPENFIFRTREFEQMEMQYFVEPGEDEKYFDYWKKDRMEFYKKLDFSDLRFKEHGKDELAHYAKAAFDIEYKFPFGWQELEGIHNRIDYDLKKHQKLSKKNLSYFKEKSHSFIPYVVETAVGCDRLVLAALCNAYSVDPKADNRVVMKFPFDIAPIKIAVLPLLKQPMLMNYAKQLCNKLSEICCAQYDDTGSIGKRYRRQDEIGTPFCVTVDFDTIGKGGVELRDRDNPIDLELNKKFDSIGLDSKGEPTIRYRDDMSQKRLTIPAIIDEIKNKA